MRRYAITVFVLVGLFGQASAQPATQKPAAEAVAAMDDPAQLKATIVKLQKAVLALRKENGMLQATVAELQDAALEAAIDTLPADVKKALGRADKPVTPQTPPKDDAPKSEQKP